MLSILASLCFLVAWALMTAQVFVKRKNPSDPVVSLFFTLGILLSAINQYDKSEPLFVLFAIAVCVMAFIDFYYIPRKLFAFKKEIQKAEKIIKKEIKTLRSSYHHISRLI